jgi:uncharacterized membrane protein YgcG
MKFQFLLLGLLLALFTSCSFENTPEEAEAAVEQNWEAESTASFEEDYELSFSPAVNTFSDPSNIISRPPDKDAVQERIDTLKNSLGAAISVNIVETNNGTSSKNIALHILEELKGNSRGVLVIVISKEEQTAAVAATESIMSELEDYEETNIKERVAPSIMEGDHVGALLMILNDFERIFNPQLEE